MGLDLYLYKVKNENEILYSNWDELEKNELCYGRKTWNIAYAFKSRAVKEVDEVTYEIPEEAWDWFIKTAAPYINDNFLAAINRYWRGEDTEEDYELFEKVINAIEEDYIPQLDYGWEASAIYNWFVQDVAVRQALQDGYKLYMIMSY